MQKVLGGCLLNIFGAARLSYVGEAGWELTCRAQNASAIYAALTTTGAKPAGLFAQTSMRVEKGFCAMGHELDSDISLIEAGLARATRSTGGFVGAEAMQQRAADGAVPRIVSIQLNDENAVPLGHEPIYLDGKIIGQTTSTAFGYRVGKPVALAYLKNQVVEGTKVQVDIARTNYSATISFTAAYDPRGLRMRTSIEN